jgi:hypothetical protein
MLAGAIAVATASAAGSARADDADVAAAARAAYDRGKAAFEAKRYAEAANAFARADALAPNAVALASALKVAALADDPALAMTLAERAEQRAGVGEEALAAARKLREKFASRAGKLTVRCASACTATVDAEAFPVDRPRWVTAGAHALEVSAGGATTKQTIVVEGEKSVEWQAPTMGPQAAPNPVPSVEMGPQAAPNPAPPLAAPVAKGPPVAAPAPETSGISPAWFFVGLGVTAAVGGVTLWSGLDTLSKHSDFVEGRTLDPSDGKAAQMRTNVLIGVTAGAGVATAAIGIFAVRWRAPKSAASIQLTPAPGGALVRARF